NGRKSHLFGKLSATSWPYYFPVAVGLKTTLPLLILALVGLVSQARRREADWRLALPPLGVALISPALAPARVALAVCHILPVRPLRGSRAGAAGARLVGADGKVAEVGVVGLLVGHGAESAAAHPDCLAYCNQLGGKPPERLIADSNLDWGQDLLRLGDEL